MDINIKLSERSIDEAMEAVTEYKKMIERKAEKLRTEVANHIWREMQSGFDNAFAEVGIGGYYYDKADVDVEITEEGGCLLVMATGRDVVFCEFGAGVFYNGGAGTSPHPLGERLGFTIGSFGKGLGKRRAWGYYDGNDYVVTQGTPASMPIHRAVESVCGQIFDIAHGVFDGD